MTQQSFSLPLSVLRKVYALKQQAKPRNYASGGYVSYFAEGGETGYGTTVAPPTAKNPNVMKQIAEGKINANVVLVQDTRWSAIKDLTPAIKGIFTGAEELVELPGTVGSWLGFDTKYEVDLTPQQIDDANARALELAKTILTDYYGPQEGPAHAIRLFENTEFVGSFIDPTVLASLAPKAITALNKGLKALPKAYVDGNAAKIQEAAAEAARYPKDEQEAILQGYIDELIADAEKRGYKVIQHSEVPKGGFRHNPQTKEIHIPGGKLSIKGYLVAGEELKHSLGGAYSAVKDGAKLPENIFPAEVNAKLSVVKDLADRGVEIPADALESVADTLRQYLAYVVGAGWDRPEVMKRIVNNLPRWDDEVWGVMGYEEAPFVSRLLNPGAKDRAKAEMVRTTADEDAFQAGRRGDNHTVEDLARPAKPRRIVVVMEGEIIEMPNEMVVDELVDVTGKSKEHISKVLNKGKALYTDDGRVIVEVRAGETAEEAVARATKDKRTVKDSVVDPKTGEVLFESVAEYIDHYREITDPRYQFELALDEVYELGYNPEEIFDFHGKVIRNSKNEKGHIMPDLSLVKALGKDLTDRLEFWHQLIDGQTKSTKTATTMLSEYERSLLTDDNIRQILKEGRDVELPRARGR